MPLRADAYRVRRNDPLGSSDFWNFRLLDIDARIALIEQIAQTIEDAKDAMVSVMLQRMTDTFTPLIIDAQNRLNTLGASFFAESQSSLAIGTGTKVFLLTAETAANFVFVDYVSVRAAADQSNSMLGQVTAFDRAAKLLTVNVVSTTGAGTFADWLIRVGIPPDLTHADRTDNPHETTAAQVGAYTIAQANAAIAAAIAAIPGVDLSSRLAVASNLSDLADEAAARVNLGLGALAVLSTVGFGDVATNVPASAADWRGNAASKFLTPNAVWAAAPYVALTDASTIAVDLNAGFNFTVTLGGNRTLGFPTGTIKPGQSGFIDAVQPVGGGCSLGYQSGYTFDNNTAPSVDTAANRVTSLYYHARSATEVRVGLAFKSVR